jgi:hypothetical protein
VKRFLTVLLLSAIMVGCGMKKMFGFETPPPTLAETVTDVTTGGCSPMFGLMGGICTLGGMALLVFSRGTLGWRPLIGGILFMAVNYALSIYASWIFLPIVICTGALSLAWTWKVIRTIINQKEFSLKELKL